MSALLYSLIGIAISLIIILIYGIQQDNDGSIGGSIVGLFLLGAFGFGVWAGLGTYRVEYGPAVVHESLKGRHLVVVCTNISNIIFEGYDVDKINTKTKFFWKVEYNHYNCETSRSLKYKNVD